MYVKCPSIPAAMAAVSALHGRWFAGKVCLFVLVKVSRVSPVCSYVSV